MTRDETGGGQAETVIGELVTRHQAGEQDKGNEHERMGTNNETVFMKSTEDMKSRLFNSTSFHNSPGQ